MHADALRRPLCAGLAVACVLSSVACGEPARKRLAGDYWMVRQAEGDTTFYVEGPPPREDRGGGALDGAVTRLGWNDAYIVAWRLPVSGAEREGWMVVSVRDRRIQGPLSQVELDRKKRDDAGLRSVTVEDAAEAWRRLSGNVF